jgi:hypothetical protein
MTHICLAATIVPARLVIRETTTGLATAWPLLVAKCPFTDWWRPHWHAHTLCLPGARQFKIAPCNRRPYILAVTA